MSDNGFGAKDNSADYVLRVDRIDPDFKVPQHHGDGSIKVESFFTLHDLWLANSKIARILGVFVEPDFPITKM